MLRFAVLPVVARGVNPVFCLELHSGGMANQRGQGIRPGLGIEFLRNSTDLKRNSTDSLGPKRLLQYLRNKQECARPPHWLGCSIRLTKDACCSHFNACSVCCTSYSRVLNSSRSREQIKLSFPFEPREKQERIAFDGAIPQSATAWLDD